jgi:predicted PurR-regulated permease PerM
MAPPGRRTAAGKMPSCLPVRNTQPLVWAGAPVGHWPEQEVTSERWAWLGIHCHETGAGDREWSGMIAERILMGLLLGGVAVGCVLVLYPFLSALLWAGILVYTTWPVFEWLRFHLHLRRAWAALLMVTLTAVVLVLPIGVAAPGSAEDVTHLRHVIMESLRGGLPDSPLWVFDIPLIGTVIGDLWNRWAADISVMLEALRPYFGLVVENGLSLLLGIANGVLMFLLALFVAFFFYVYGEPIAARVSLLLHRIAGVQAERLITVTGATVRGVVYGILGTAVVQGILTALGLWLSGVPRPVLLGTVAGLLAVLPIGAPLVWIPAALWLLGSGHVSWGIFLAIYGVGAISGADSLIRPWFISRGAQLPFLLTVLGVLGGAVAFGLLGIFLGPVLLGIGFTLVNEWARGADPRQAAVDH